MDQVQLYTTYINNNNNNDILHYFFKQILVSITKNQE
jgi:hypothetical protein